jgi:hypothetical protein
MVDEEVFLNCYNLNSITSVRKGNFQGLFIKVSGPGAAWSQSRNSELRHRGAGAERNIFSFATLELHTPS